MQSDLGWDKRSVRSASIFDPIVTEWIVLSYSSNKNMETMKTDIITLASLCHIETYTAIIKGSHSLEFFS